MGEGKGSFLHTQDQSQDHGVDVWQAALQIQQISPVTGLFGCCIVGESDV